MNGRWLVFATLVACDNSTEPEVPAVLSDLEWTESDTFVGPVTVSWTQSEAATVHVEYELDGGWRRTATVEGDAGNHRTTVIGIPLGTSVPYRVVLDDGSETVEGDRPITNREVPDAIPDLAIEASTPSLWEASGDHVLLPLNTGNFSESWLSIVDRQGRIVWAVPGRYILDARVSAAGDSLIWGDIGPDLARRTRLDERLTDTALSGYYHTLIELPDGTIAWPDIGALNELGPRSATARRVWTGEGWAHQAAFNPNIQMPYINGLDYDEANDAYVLSEFWTDAIIVVSRKTGVTSWWTKSQNPHFVASPDGYDFDPPSSAFDLQHGVQVLDDGNLLLSTVRGETVVVAEYAMDDAKRTLVEVASADSGLRNGEFAWAELLPSGNVLHTLGRERAVTEMTPDGQIAWRVRASEGTAPLGRASVIADLDALMAP